MKRLKQRLISWVLVVVMMLGMVPVNTFAATDSGDGVTVYMYCADANGIVTGKDGTLLNNAPVFVTDKDSDGRITIKDAFTAMHELHHADGADAYGDGGGWITRMWGVDTYNVSYVLNNKWAYSTTTDTLKDGDYVAGYQVTDSQYSDLYTYFDETNYTATAGEVKEFTVNGYFVYGSGQDMNDTSVIYDAYAVPAGATVTVTDNTTKSVCDTTTVDTNGKFSITVPGNAGTYSILVNGTCTFTPTVGWYANQTYTDAPVVPAMTTLTVEAPSVVESVILDKTEATIKVGETETLTATVLPEDATDAAVTWTSSDEAVATVKDGVVTAVAAGTATITATAGEQSATCTVTVKKAASVVAATVDGEAFEVKLLNAEQKSYYVGLPKNHGEIVLKVEDAKITAGSASKLNYTINDAGEIVFGTSGLSVMTTSAKNTAATKYSLTMVDTANDAYQVQLMLDDSSKIRLYMEILPEVEGRPVYLTGLTVNKSAFELGVGDTDKVYETLVPSFATNANVTWASSDETVATVDKDGNVTGVKVGTATITAASGEKTASATVTVIESSPITVTVDGKGYTASHLLTKNQKIYYVAIPEGSESITIKYNGYDFTTEAGGKLVLGTDYTITDGTVTVNTSALSLLTTTAREGVVMQDAGNQLSYLRFVGTGNIDGTYGLNVYVEVLSGTIAVESVTLDKTEAILEVGATETLTATVAPEDAADKTVTWASSDEAVATVKDGVVTAVAAGTATITATAGGKSAACTVKVEVPVTRRTLIPLTKDNQSDDGEVIHSKYANVSGLQIEGVEIAGWTQWQQGGNYQSQSITVYIHPNSKDAVATLSLGLINDQIASGPLATAPANVQLSNGAGSYQATRIKIGTGGLAPQLNLNITFELADAEVESVALDLAELKLVEEESATLSATVLPVNAADKTVTWASSDEAVATVKDGVVTAVAAGTAVITATSGGKTAECNVIVSKEEDPVPEGYYRVTVNVAPKEADVTFYADGGATSVLPVDNEVVTDKGIVDDYHQYTLVLQEGTYSYRAVEGDQSLGGMEFKVPIADEYASDGTLMGKGQVLTLKRVNFYTTSKNITKPEDYTLHLYPQDLAEVVSGNNYINEDGYVVAPIMVNAGGNALTYQGMIDINGTLGETYAVTPLENITFSPGKATESRVFSVSNVTWYTITAPAEAKAQMFRQNNNYNVVEIPASKTETLENGTVKSYFATPGGQTITYRVSMKDKVTRAGYATTTNKDMVFEYKAGEDPKSTKTTANRIENSSMLNINTQNNLKLAVGETFRLRSFRAGWQIINTDTSNIMIEPDFHYNIISGAEHITMTPAVNKTTGNAGSGENSNWMDITAVSAGTVILEVSYDALQIGGDTVYSGTYGAVDPSRKSVVVINVGDDQENTLAITPAHGTHEKYVWDADFDTVYFTGDSADYNFTATMGEAAPDKVELSTDLGKSWSEVSSNDGIYNAKGLVAGNNLLRASKDGRTEYQVVRASKLEVIVTNMTRGGDVIIVGDQIRVLFSGIYTPVPKMSGIYNPGFGAGNSHKTLYQYADGITATSTSTQYGFAADNQLDITFTESGTFEFTDGYITSHVMGDDLGGHRLLTDNGRGVNMNAGGGASNRGVMPDITFEVIDMPVVTVTVVSEPEGAAVELADSKGNALTANEDGTYSLEYGTYSYKLTKEGYVPERGKFTVGGDDRLTGKKTVTIPMRAIGGAIWDGETRTEPKKDENDVYLIGTGAELAWFAANHNGASAILTADISLGGFGVQIQSLQGTFDGNGHYVTDLYGDSLFKYPKSNSVIKNLGVSGEVKGQGGIVTHSGNNLMFTIENCVSRVEVSGDYFGGSGGIVGNAKSGSSLNMPQIIDCYNAGSVNANGYGYTGGIAGYQDSNPIMYIKNCYNIGTISQYGISIAGSAGRSVNVNNYYLLGSAPNTTRAAGTGVQSDVLKTYAATLGDAYMDNPTSYNDGYPILTWEMGRAVATLVEELETYKNPEDYREAQQEELAKAIEDGKKAIEEAETLTDAVAALEDAKAVIDKIKTAEELPVETEPVEIYLSVSNDDKFVETESGEIMALKKLKVPYFDLGLYGLEQYYFVSESYTEEDKGDIGKASNYEGKVTMLHALIYATEIYYCEIEPEEAGKGYLYKEGLLGTGAFSPEGAAGSLYIRKFWGMDENFNYYHNYNYPLASEGWGSTADQVLLEDGDIITLGHFTSWDFHLDSLSVFNYIKAGDDIIQTTAKQGEDVEVTVILAGAGGDYTTAHTPMAGRGVYISEVSKMTNNPTQWNMVGTTDANGNVVIETADLEPGQYIIATPGVYGKEYTEDICSTPGGILLTVEEGEFALGDVNMDGEIDIMDANLTASYFNGVAELTVKQQTLADVNGDGEIDIMDANLIASYFNGMIASFPAES